MKISRKLELRPDRPGFLDIIPRFSGTVTKNEILLKILTPITYVLRSFKKLFKKKSSPMLNIQRGRKLPMLRGEKSSVNGIDLRYREEGDNENVSRTEAIPTERKIASALTRVRFQPKRVCPSCEEDVPVINICSLCLSLDKQLPHDSCQSCKSKGPVKINFCLRYHCQQPKICYRNNIITQDFTEEFVEKKSAKRSTSSDCSGETSAINNCPMCHNVWPTFGECECEKCKKTKPRVEFRSTRQQHCRVDIYLCPCPECRHLFPIMRICDSCRNNKGTTFKKNESIYVLVQ
uniref:Uncharacterized protein n=1 Tax=Graphocephala atropunctata TaxID=36148 RepID=A0A1B6LC16_9HEMI